MKRLFTKCGQSRKPERLGEAPRDSQELFRLIDMKTQRDGAVMRIWKF